MQNNDKTTTPSLQRRHFILGSVASVGAVSMGWMILPEGAQAADVVNGPFAANLYLDVYPDNRVVIHTNKTDMGQRITTALGQIFAEEFECDWKQVSVEMLGYDPRFGEGGFSTGGSTSVMDQFLPMSRMGAAARMTFLAAAAHQWGVDVKSLTVSDGVVQSGDRRITYAELVRAGMTAKAFSPEALAAIKLKPASQRKLIGHDVKALDLPGKTYGAAKYGIDAVVPDMVYATPMIPPVRAGAKVKTVDDTEAKKMPGYLGHVVCRDTTATVLSELVVSVADSYWTAYQAHTAIKVDYDPGPYAQASLASIMKENHRLIEEGKNGSVFVAEGGLAGVANPNNALRVESKRAGTDAKGVDKAMASAERRHEATYTTGIAHHMQMEPMNCTVEIKGDIFHIHTGCQQTSLAVDKLKEMGLPESRLQFHAYQLGGGFGRRLDVDYVVLAVMTAQKIKKNVKLLYSRQFDTKMDFTRPATTMKLQAGTVGGKIDSWISRCACAWPTLRQYPQYLSKSPSPHSQRKTYDPFTTGGGDHWYTVPNQLAVLYLNQMAQDATPSGHLRSVGPGWQCFAVESFVDEIAEAEGLDPLALRLSMLDGSGRNAGKGPTEGGALRLKKVLEEVVSRSGYGKPLPDDTAIGIACVPSQERGIASWTACAARVKVTDKASGKFVVEKLSLVTEMGILINPEGAHDQAMGGMLWGLSLATIEEGHFDKGEMQQQQFLFYALAQMGNVPEMDIHVMQTDHRPTGAGEPATTPVAPAIANAIARVTGARVRDLPITPAKVKAAMTKA